MVVYDLLAGKLGIGRSRWMSLAQTLAALPTVVSRGLRGGVQYYDAQFDDARLAVSLLRTLFNLGGNAVNYLPVVGLIKQGEGAAQRVAGVSIHHPRTGQTLDLMAKSVINATGVWVDDIRRMDSAQAKSMLAPSQGVHLVVDRSFLPSEHALLIPKTDDGRVLFVVPWYGKTVLGTTDTPREDAPYEPRPLEEEVEFILSTARQFLDKKPSRADVLSVFVGLRPLVKEGDEDGNTAGISREHAIRVSKTGLITITGGKWTTYRAMAQEVIDKAIQVAKLPKRQSQTHNLLLHGALAAPVRLNAQAQPMDPLGSDRALVESFAEGQDRLHPRLDLTGAMVRFFVQQELAFAVEDVLARRHRALFLDARSAMELAPAVADILAEQLGWDAQQRDAELDRFLTLARSYCLSPA
jgi:glycerol-3-phosphate dehydrogenase